MAESGKAPDSTAIRVALWRALHVEADAPPNVFEDTIGLQLAAPDAGWRQRGDMHVQGTAGFRSSIVARARFVEDLLLDRAARGDVQYVILGAGLDTFAQRHSDATGITEYEVDEPATQAWKRSRLAELGLPTPQWLRFVPVDFEGGASWLDELANAGFDATRPALVVSTGVSMYLTQPAIEATLRAAAGLAAGSPLALTFLLPPALVDAAEPPAYECVLRGARASGTPFRSLFAPEDMVALTRAAGFAQVEHVSMKQLGDDYFAGRPDELRPSTGEAFVVATV
jgi:methyltransferase (TIGR00027 family)